MVRWSSPSSLTAACGLLWFASSASTSALLPTRADTDAPVVTVKNGSYAGVYSAAYAQDFFLGVPYAQPPVRFSNSVPLNASWNGTRDATAYSDECVGYGSDQIGYTVSEDCLYLNVIRPAGISETADLPVALWIHGGGLYEGGAPDRRYNLSFIVQNSVELGTPIVAVSINYRLSAFGFIAGDEATNEGVVNLGFKDQRLALRWVNENIAAFGGDPDKVTIFGESSGAESVSAQVLAYNGRDDGLFRGAIGQSGFGGALSRYAGNFNNTAANQATYNLLVSNTSCASTVNTSASLACLRALPFAEINAALNGTEASPWPPVLDGDFIADWPSQQLLKGNFPKIPILIGTNTDEGAAFGSGRGPNGTMSTDEDMEYAIANILGPDAAANTGKTEEELIDELMAVYPDIQAIGIPGLDKWPVIEPGDFIATYLGLQYRRGAALFGDYSMHYLRRRANLAWSNYGVPSYSYRFDVVVNGIPGYVGATHFQEVAFVFDNTAGYGYATNPFANESAAYPALAKTMSDAWVNFFVSLDPNGATGLPDWPVYNATSGGGVGTDMVWSVNGSYTEVDAWRAEGIEWMIENSYAVFGD